MENGEGHHF